jgi:hypothetical protein
MFSFPVQNPSTFLGWADGECEWEGISRGAEGKSSGMGKLAYRGKSHLIRLITGKLEDQYLNKRRLNSKATLSTTMWTCFILSILRQRAPIPCILDVRNVQEDWPCFKKWRVSFFQLGLTVCRLWPPFHVAQADALSQYHLLKSWPTPIPGCMLLILVCICNQDMATSYIDTHTYTHTDKHTHIGKGHMNKTQESYAPNFFFSVYTYISTI